MNLIPCSKRRYKSEAEADEAKGRILVESPSIKIDHSYLCPFCGMWHLTSMSKGKSRKAARGFNIKRKLVWAKFMKP